MYKSNLALLILFLIIAQVFQDSSAKEIQYSLSSYTTFATKCTISFQIKNEQRIFSKCIRKKCVQNLIHEKCKLQQMFDLNQLKCYNQCCGQTVFDPDLCAQYNFQYEIRSKNVNKIIVSFLSIAIIILIGSIMFLIFVQLKCFEKPVLVQQKKQTSKAITWNNSNTIINNKRCQICQQQGVWIQTQCLHYFHLECFVNHLSKNECPGCKFELFQRFIIVYCNGCWEKQFTIQYRNILSFEKTIYKAKDSHLDLCYKNYIRSSLYFS